MIFDVVQDSLDFSSTFLLFDIYALFNDCKTSRSQISFVSTRILAHPSLASMHYRNEIKHPTHRRQMLDRIKCGIEVEWLHLLLSPLECHLVILKSTAYSNLGILKLRKNVPKFLWGFLPVDDETMMDNIKVVSLVASPCYTELIFIQVPNRIQDRVVGSNEPTHTSDDTVRYKFAVACAPNHPIRNGWTNEREVQTCLRLHWPGYIPLARIPPILYMTAWFVNTLQCIFKLLGGSPRLHLRSFGRSHSNAYW